MHCLPGTASQSGGDRWHNLATLIGKIASVGRFLATSGDRRVAESEFTAPQRGGGAVLIQVRLERGVRIAWIPPVGWKEFAYQRELLVHPEMVQRIVGVDGGGSMPVVQVEVTSE